MSNIIRQTIDALLPKGSAWDVEPDGGLDLLLDGVADSKDITREFLANLAYLRDSTLTPILDDLEKEYGLVRNSRLTEAERISRLIAARTDRSGFGADYLQGKLQAAGFDVLVHINNPPADPNLILNISGPQFDLPTAIFGNEEAIFTGAGIDVIGELLVNGDIWIETLVGPVVDGKYDVDREPVEYTVPTGTTYLNTFGSEESVFGFGNPAGYGPDGSPASTPRAVFGAVIDWSKYWALVFFVGGTAIRDSAGVITEIYPAEIPTGRREELKRLIVQHKPSHSWCGLVVNYI